MSSLQSPQTLPILYSFRRCPYAMRARMAIHYSQLQVELREVALKNKPSAMLKASAKATVPVLVLNDGTVIDESLEIMLWALYQNDPEAWLQTDKQSHIFSLIDQNDNIFKTHLDHYKYSDRFPDHSPIYYRQQAEMFLRQLEQLLEKNHFLFASNASIADIALFPFIRQFAYVDIKWFDNSPYPQLIKWLHYWLETDHFLASMTKQPPWLNTQTPVIF